MFRTNYSFETCRARKNGGIKKLFTELCISLVIYTLQYDILNESGTHTHTHTHTEQVRLIKTFFYSETEFRIGDCGRIFTWNIWNSTYKLRWTSVWYNYYAQWYKITCCFTNTALEFRLWFDVPYRNSIRLDQGLNLWINAKKKHSIQFQVTRMFLILAFHWSSSHYNLIFGCQSSLIRLLDVRIPWATPAFDIWSYASTDVSY